jgi:hypothetical protein
VEVKFIRREIGKFSVFFLFFFFFFLYYFALFSLEYRVLCAIDYHFSFSYRSVPSAFRCVRSYFLFTQTPQEIFCKHKWEFHMQILPVGRAGLVYLVAFFFFLYRFFYASLKPRRISVSFFSNSKTPFYFTTRVQFRFM